MVEAAVCSADFLDFLSSTIFPIAAVAGVIAGAVIAVTYMAGQALSNPKLTVWSKTEIVQLFISFASLLLLGSLFGFFCGLNMQGIASVFEIGYSGPPNMFDAAENYLLSSAEYSHNALAAVRYHLKAYTILGYMGMFQCTSLSSGLVIAFPFLSGCGYGYSGTSGLPFGGYAALNTALNTVFNSTLMSYVMSLNYLIILMYIYRGFAFFLFPIGIFLRSMPYMRGLGSTLISVAIAFTIVFPFFLAVFDLMGDGIFKSDPSLMNRDHLYDADLYPFTVNEDVFPENSAGVGISIGSGLDPDLARELYFQSPPGMSGPMTSEAIAFGGAAFIAAFFLPSVAMLGAIASVVYLGRLYGEEIDLSRIMRMV